MRSIAALVAATCCLAALVSCSRAERAPPAPVPAHTQEDPLRALREFESARRAATDFGHLPASHEAFGPDPYALRALPAGGYAGILRGRAAIVQLDAELRETARLPAPASPSAIAVAPNGEVYVAGERSSRVARYAVGANGALAQSGEVDLGEDVRAVRDLAVGDGRALYAVEDHDHRLIVVRGGRRDVVALPLGPTRVLRVARHLLVDCLLDHTVVIFDLSADGTPKEAGRITHDGPIWGMDATVDGGELVIALGGVEDHPLDRREGFFGYVDSFVFVYRGARRERAVNVSEHGVVTPKALAIAGDVVRVTGYGGDHMAEIGLSGGDTEARPLPPGTSAIAPRANGGFVAANPLLDAWIDVDASGAWRAVHVPDDDHPARSDASKIGEALIFTTLISPWGKSDGALSRFTCETCHFEGFADGRTHHTGRGDVHATTKPLFGLFNNEPHFTRALDPDLSSVADNEFRVAASHTEHSPFFTVTVADFPWLAELRLSATRFDATELRRAFMTFLMEMTPRPNPTTGPLTPPERAGAGAFRDRCESCHAARLVTDDPKTHVPFERWEELVTSEADPITWASAEYRKTGVEPYVNDLGARTSSLRRLYKKRPYFTNGSARSLEDVLARARVMPDGAFMHDAHDAGGRALDEPTRQALLAFLDRL